MIPIHRRFDLACRHGRPQFHGRNLLLHTQAGLNAAVVGILAAALWDPVITNSITGLTEGLLAFSDLILLTRAKCPQWAWVLLAAAAGQRLLG